jgi:hypothetical protein
MEYFCIRRGLFTLKNARLFLAPAGKDILLRGLCAMGNGTYKRQVPLVKSKAIYPFFSLSCAPFFPWRLVQAVSWFLFSRLVTYSYFTSSWVVNGLFLAKHQ